MLNTEKAFRSSLLVLCAFGVRLETLDFRDRYNSLSALTSALTCLCDYDTYIQKVSNW